MLIPLRTGRDLFRLLGLSLLLTTTACTWMATGDPALQSGIIGAVREWSLTLLAAGLLYLLPGWALLRLWDGAARLTLPEQAALATGVGMAIYPVFLLLTDLIGLKLGALYAWLPPLAALPLLFWTYRRQRHAGLEGWRARERGGNLWPNIALFVVLAAIIGVRSVAVTDIQVPLWADSLHHTMITQLIIDNGGLFRSWQPYASIQTFTYHFGFHTQVAAFIWATGFETPRAVVLSGQVANIAAVFALYPLALRLGRTRWAGVVALLLAGLLAPMPMFYVNWGRYTQLAGQVIMPVGIYLVWELLARQKRSWALLGLVCLTLAGMMFTHYRIAIFVVCFFPAFALVMGVKLPWRGWVGRGALIALGVGVIVIPWFMRVLGGKLLNIIMITTSATVATGGRSAPTDAANSVGDLYVYLPPWMWYTIPLAIFWALWRRERGVILVAFWWAMIALVVNPQWLMLPGAGNITNFAMIIAAYIPASLLIGAAAGWLLRRLRTPLVSAGLVLAVAVISWWGVGPRLHDVAAEATALVAPADLEAAKWIAANTPTDTLFLVNGYYLNRLVVIGSDGGWWLPVLAHRQNTLPPMTYALEQGSGPDYHQRINQVYTALYEQGVNDPRTMALLRERGVTHVYIGQRQGTVGYTGANHVLAPEILLSNPAFRPIYHQDQVWVFALLPE